MKRTVGILAGLAAMGVSIYLGSHVLAQQPPQTQAAPPLQSKIALVNLAQVIKNYEKFKNFQAQLKTEMEPLQKEIEAKKGQLAAKEAEGNKPETPAARREQLQKEIKAIQREMQDKIDEANNVLAKKRVEQLQTIYRDVQDAVTAYARAYNIELVLQFSDSIDPAEKVSPAALQAKLGNQACFPLYNDPRMDITNPVTQMLNQHMSKQPIQQTGATAPAPRR